MALNLNSVQLLARRDSCGGLKKYRLTAMSKLVNEQVQNPYSGSFSFLP